MQKVFILKFFFAKIDGYRCDSNCMKGGRGRVQITSKFLNHPLFSFFFASKAHVSDEQLAGFLGFFLASFLGMANNTPNFTSTSIMKFELHILT